MSKTAATDANIDLEDEAANARDDDDISDEDLGSELLDGEEEEEEEPKAKKPAKKADDDDDDDPDAEEDAPEEEDNTAAETAKLAGKLKRAGEARERLEAQVRELQGKFNEQAEKSSEAGRTKFEALMTELDGLYETVEEHRAKGETGPAAKAQRRIDQINGDMTRSQAALQASKSAMQQTELRAFNTMVKELEFLDARFDPDSEDFDQDTLDDVNEAVEAFEAKGLLLTDALRKACKIKLGEDIFARGRSLKRDGKKDNTPAAKKTDVEKNIKAAKRQPPDEPGTRKEKATELPDMATISEKDYDALPDSVKRRLEGSV